MNELTHFSDVGRARMVDVSAKSDTRRGAIASGVLRMQPATLERIRAGRIAKGDVLTVADGGAVMAAKRTSDMIPMCHPIALTGVNVEFSEITDPDASGCVGIKVVTTASCVGQTGVEMVALCPGLRLQDVRDELAAQYPQAFEIACFAAANGEHVRDLSRPLADNSEVALLARFSG